MLLIDGAGAVAAFASTGMTNANVQKLLDQGFIEAIFLALLLLTSPLPWTHCLTKAKKRGENRSIRH